MGIIRIYEKPGKVKRKPGWQLEAAAYQAWLAKLNGQKTSFSSGRTTPKRTGDPLQPGPASTGPSHRPARYVIDGGTKSVARPEHTYRDNPEMLEREVAARGRKFNVAPAYNKGNDVFITEEELQNTLSSNKRRS